MHIYLDIVVVHLIRCQQRVDPILRVQKCRERLVGKHQPIAKRKSKRRRNPHCGTPGKRQLDTTT